MINPFKNKRGLGRGLSSLIGDSNLKQETNKISISSIIPNKFQPRKKFDNLDLEELANSIKERGILQPMKSLEFAIIENVQRKDLNIIEEATSYQRLIDEFSYDQYKVSKFIGKSRSHISNCLRLLSLSEKLKNYIVEGNLSYGHAKVLVGVEDADIIADKIISKKLSVRQTENLIRLLKHSSFRSNLKRDVNIVNLEKELSEKTGLNVFLKNKKNNSGTFILEYKELDQLERLIKIIKENY